MSFYKPNCCTLAGFIWFYLQVKQKQFWFVCKQSLSYYSPILNVLFSFLQHSSAYWHSLNSFRLHSIVPKPFLSDPDVCFHHVLKNSRPQTLKDNFLVNLSKSKIWDMYKALNDRIETSTQNWEDCIFFMDAGYLNLQKIWTGKDSRFKMNTVCWRKPELM